MQKQKKQILHEISKIEALLRFKRFQNAKRKKNKETKENSDVSEAVADYKNLKENMINSILSFFQPRLTYQYAKVRIKSK